MAILINVEKAVRYSLTLIPIIPTLKYEIVCLSKIML